VTELNKNVTIYTKLNNTIQSRFGVHEYNWNWQRRGSTNLKNNYQFPES